jgi:hypothetical protein
VISRGESTSHAGGIVRSRLFFSVIVLVGGLLAAACSSTGIGAADLLGVWDLHQFNGVTMPGQVWVLLNGGTDSAQTTFESVSLEFTTATACIWRVDIDTAPLDSLPCVYDIAKSGNLSIALAGTNLLGTADTTTITVTDEDTNVLVFGKR